MHRRDEAELRIALDDLLGPDFRWLAEGAESAPADKGAYALAIYLPRPLVLPWRRHIVPFAVGWHVYAGNANGPGGIRARLRHHLRRDKRPHWHVDRLTNEATLIDALVAANASECDVVDKLLGSERFAVPVPGFGSSDCSRCPSHLLRFVR